jgi:proprotein convertase subtilisin/kexin type 5
LYCQTCQNSSVCSKCYDGYFLDSTYCNPCPENCQKCSNSLTCLTCS